MDQILCWRGAGDISIGDNSNPVIIKYQVSRRDKLVSGTQVLALGTLVPPCHPTNSLETIWAIVLKIGQFDA